MARSQVRARSIVGLYREVTIGSLPIEEVRADLGRLGIDPARSIYFAKRLSDGNAENPAAALLRMLERTDAAAAEIADIEHAPIESIRSSLPEDVIQSTIAAGGDWADEVDHVEPDAAATRGDGTILPILKRRRAVLGWGGSLVGIAAGIMLLVALAPDLLQLADDTAAPLSSAEIEVAGASNEPSIAQNSVDQAFVEDRGAAVQLPAVQSRASRVLAPPIDRIPSSANPGLSAKSTVDAAEAEDVLSRLADAVKRRTSAEPGPSTPSAAASPVATAELSQAETITSPHRPILKPAPGDRQRSAVAAASTASLSAANLSPPSTAVPPSSSGIEAAPADGVEGLPDNLLGIFVVDYLRLPTGLIVLEAEKRDDQLAARLGEAGLRALGRKVLALVAFERDGERIEAAVVEAEGEPEDTEVAADGSDRRQPGFELLELPNAG